MSDDKDQNRDALTPSSSDEEVYDISEIDAVIADEDPEFLSQINEIKITGSGANLSVMDEAFVVAAQSEIRFRDQLLQIFNYAKNPRLFTLFWSIVSFIVLLFFLTWGVTKNFFPQKLFLTSFADLGENVRDYNPLTETEAFYDNPKFSKNIMTLSKMFINVQPSASSGPNPMLALEVNVEGLAADAIIEIKDREAEFKDLLLRYTEEKNYDELTTTAGKQDLCDQFRRVINSHLTRGQVRKVLLNSFIIKP